MSTTLTELGIHDNVPSSLYHAHDSLSASGMKILATQTPAHFRYRMDHPTTSAAFDLGTAAHSLVLEDDHSTIEVCEFDDWRTKAAREERDAAYGAGKTPLLTKDYAVVKAMRDAVAAHPVARLALEGGKAEQSIFWDHETGTRLRCRPDKFDPESKIGPLVADLKTSVSADPRKFAKSVADFGYHQQQPHYQDGAKTILGVEPAFLFIVIEKAPPYLVSVIELDADAIATGRALNRKAVRIYNECRATNTWPGYPQSEPISLPAWAHNTGEAA